jgi:hypothetical protein
VPLHAATSLGWTYLNCDAVIRLDVVTVGRGFHLLISPSAGQSETDELAERQPLLAYHARYEARLRAHGDTLVATRHERRGGGDRRRHPYPGRRRQPDGSR